MPNEFRTSVGGQALMEGIMMRGPEKICCAVRKPDGTIDLTYDKVVTRWYNKVPLLRGVCNMAENLYKGYKYLMHAADVAMEGFEDAEPESKLDKWLDEHTGPVFQNVLMTCAAFAGVALALFLFTFLPTFLTGQLIRFIPLGRWGRVILEGALKMAVFLLYMFLCTRMKELHRVFEYHGAEHKTIACYEAGLPLTVENIRKQSRFHPRCGTSFMILVIIISIFLYAVLPWTSTGLRIVYKLCMFPLLVGVCYEILKWAGRSHSMLSRIVSQPGLWMQRLTTFEPDDSMIEVAIAAVPPVLPENQEYVLRFAHELLTKYKFDGYALDYCRFPDAESDFSPASREAFETYLGHGIDRFPEDIFTYDANGARVAGPYYKQWWEFRSGVIRDFIAEVRTLIERTQPGVKLEYWAASWLHAIYTQGQNWASPRSRFHEAYLDDWATPTYNRTGFADLLDVFITGTYLEKVWGMDDPESIEYGLARSLKDVDGDCAVYGSLYAQNHVDQFEDAVYLCLSRTDGVMVFDIIQVIENDLWDDIKRGIDRAEKEQKTQK